VTIKEIVGDRARRKDEADRANAQAEAEAAAARAAAVAEAAAEASLDPRPGSARSRRHALETASEQLPDDVLLGTPAVAAAGAGGVAAEPLALQQCLFPHEVTSQAYYQNHTQLFDIENPRLSNQQVQHVR
jgi:hypothetical protein